MIRLPATTWSIVEFSHSQLGMPLSELQGLPWAEAKVASIESGPSGVRIRIGPYAGRLVIPGKFIIDVAELVPSTVASLTQIVASRHRWRETWTEVSSIRVAPWTGIIKMFVDLLYLYVGKGIERRYLSYALDTSRPRGRINLRRTYLRHRSRGRVGVLACDVRVLTDDTPVSRVLLSAALRAESALAADGEMESLVKLRESILALTGATPQHRPDVRAARAHALGGDEDVRTILELADLLIAGVALLPEGVGGPEQPVSVWVNLWVLFEHAIRTLVSECCRDADVHAGRGDGVQLLNDGGNGTDDLSADPDVVVRSIGRVGILDAKYRRHSEGLQRPELYQLIAHANAYGASHAALVAPRLPGVGDSRVVGRDPAGRTYELLVVDPTDPADMKTRLQAWLERSGLTTTGAAAPSLVQPTHLRSSVSV